MKNSINSINLRRNRQSGLSLIEVLIAVVVASIGLLGLAGMQATGLQNNHSAYHRSQATVLAYDIADRMRSNMGSVSKYLDEYETPKVRYLTKVIMVDGMPQTIVEIIDEREQLQGCKTTGGCTSAQMARTDVFTWQQNLAATLPSGVGTIVQNSGLYTVNIRWDDNRSGGIDEVDPNFSMNFRL